LDNRFCKEERLTGKITFEKLVKKGNSIYQFPFKVYFLSQKILSHDNIPTKLDSSSVEVPNLYPAKIGISIPKRKFKRAVDRNKIKRHIRESYRNLKEIELYSFLKENNIFLEFLLVYTHHEILEAKIYTSKVRSLLIKIRNGL
jgi:ribonuclease P protein component